MRRRRQLDAGATQTECYHLFAGTGRSPRQQPRDGRQAERVKRAIRGQNAMRHRCQAGVSWRMRDKGRGSGATGLKREENGGGGGGGGVGGGGGIVRRFRKVPYYPRPNETGQPLISRRLSPSCLGRHSPTEPRLPGPMWGARREGRSGSKNVLGQVACWEGLRTPDPELPQAVRA